MATDQELPEQQKSIVLERPTDYEFEPELEGSPPREIPPEFFSFPYHQRRMNAHRALFTAAIICDVLSLIPQVDQVALFFLPLQYLLWIGIGLMVIGAIVYFVNRSSLGNLEYIRRGEKYVGTVIDVAIAPGQIVNGVVSAWNYVARVAVWKPDAEQPEIRDFVASVSSTHKSKTRMDYRVGDTATVVEVPGDKQLPMQLYGFLGVRPDIGLVRTDDKAMTMLEVIATVCVVFLFIGGLLAMLVLGNVYGPIGSDAQIGVCAAIGAAVVGLPASVFMIRRRRAAARRDEERRQEAIARGEAVETAPEVGRFAFAILLLGTFMLGGVVTAVGAITINGIFDDSKPEWKPVRITGMFQNTHNFIAREYYIEYDLSPKDSRKKLYCTPWHMAKFPAPQMPAFAAVHKGAFGMPWVRTIEPWIPKE